MSGMNAMKNSIYNTNDLEEIPLNEMKVNETSLLDKINPITPIKDKILDVVYDTGYILTFIGCVIVGAMILR